MKKKIKIKSIELFIFIFIIIIKTRNFKVKLGFGPQWIILNQALLAQVHPTHCYWKAQNIFSSPESEKQSLKQTRQKLRGNNRSRRRLEKEASRESVEMAGVAQAPKRALAPQGRGLRSPPRPRFAPVDREKVPFLFFQLFFYKNLFFCYIDGFSFLGSYWIADLSPVASSFH